MYQPAFDLHTMIPEGTDAAFSSQPSPVAAVIERAIVEESHTLALARLAHDFANAVTGISSLSESCLDDAPEGSPLRESLELIHATFLQAHGILRTMAAINQTNSGPHYVVPASWLEENQPMLRSLLHKSTQLTVSKHPDGLLLVVPCPLKLWVDWMAQAMLLSRRSLEVRHVTINTSQQGGIFEFSLSDDGPELPEQLLEPMTPEAALVDPQAQRIYVLRSMTERMGGSMHLENQVAGGIGLHLTVRGE